MSGPGQGASAGLSGQLELPPDALVLLVGASGSGKSTWAGRHFTASAVLSSDAFRELVAGDAADQAATADAFAVLHLAARARLRRGLLTVIDATNLTSAARRPLLGLARRFARPAVAVVFDVSLPQSLERNARRPGRRVPDAVVRRHHGQLRAALRALPGEGFRAIHVLADADLAR